IPSGNLRKPATARKSIVSSADDPAVKAHRTISAVGTCSWHHIGTLLRDRHPYLSDPNRIPRVQQRFPPGIRHRERPYGKPSVCMTMYPDCRGQVLRGSYNAGRLLRPPLTRNGMEAEKV